jgi:hypothetical protein
MTVLQMTALVFTTATILVAPFFIAVAALLYAVRRPDSAVSGLLRAVGLTPLAAARPRRP